MGGRGKAQRAPAPSREPGHVLRPLPRPPILSGTAHHCENPDSLVVDGVLLAAWACLAPSTNLVAAITSFKSDDPFKDRQLFDPLSIGLWIIVNHAGRLT